MMHNNNRNKNRRFNKNNNFKNRNFRTGNNNSGNSNNGFEDEQISPQQRRNFENKRDQHLAKAKEYLSAGERIEAENHFQHADHYHRMAIIGLDKLLQQQQAQAQLLMQYKQQNPAGADAAEQADYNESAQEADVISDSEENVAAADAPEIPVDMMGNFPSQNADSRTPRQPRQRGPRNNRDVKQAAPVAAVEAGSEAAVNNDIAALPFMQMPIKE